ncbi:MAG: ribonuclease P protein component [Candidatus Latescibacterota bacterium]|nr:ribonuclease P protein component [Candidatus Latescibacterota bacterium]
MGWIRQPSLWVRRGKEPHGFVIVVRKKLGNAVVRNRLKRRLRAIVRSTERNCSMSVVILCQPSAVRAPFSELKRELASLVSQLEKR